MTKQDYIIIAASIAQARQATEINRNINAKVAGVKAIYLTAIGTASHLAQDNPRFDRGRFLQACGF